MKFIILQHNLSPPEAQICDAEDLLAPMSLEQQRDPSQEPSMPYLSLVRRQIGNIITMKLVLRSHGAE